MDYQLIYAQHAEAYDTMVRAEDCDGNLAREIADWLDRIGRRVLEVGVGTGRVTAMLCARGAQVVGCEPAPAMLEIARRRLSGYDVELIECDCLGLPRRKEAFDLAIAGWVFGHLRSWRAADWRESIAENLDRMNEALVPGGALVVIETLGTGESTPRPPRPELAEYYAWLENDCGFERRTLRTDYGFADSEAAARATEFFFGADFAARVRGENWARIPECTGLWWRRKPVQSTGT